MRTSYQGRCFIAQREACVLVGYADGKHYSIGFGHNDPTLTPSSKITLSEAWALLKEDLKPRETSVSTLLKVPVPQHQYDALVSVYYQTGNKLGRVIDPINAGEPDEAMAMLMTINRDYTHNKFKIGLAKRRLQEAFLFMKGEYGDLSTLKLFSGNPKTTSYTEIPFPADEEAHV